MRRLRLELTFEGIEMASEGARPEEAAAALLRFAEAAGLGACVDGATAEERLFAWLKAVRGWTLRTFDVMRPDGSPAETEAWHRHTRAELSAVMHRSVWREVRRDAHHSELKVTRVMRAFTEGGEPGWWGVSIGGMRGPALGPAEALELAAELVSKAEDCKLAEAGWRPAKEANLKHLRKLCPDIEVGEWWHLMHGRMSRAEALAALKPRGCA